MGNCCRRPYGKEDVTEVLDKLLKETEEAQQMAADYEYRVSQQNLWLWFGCPSIFLLTGVIWALSPIFADPRMNAFVLLVGPVLFVATFTVYKLCILYYNSRLSAMRLRLGKLRKKQELIEKDWESLDEVKRLVRAQDAIKKIKEVRSLLPHEIERRQREEQRRAQEQLERAQKKKEEEWYLMSLKTRVEQMETVIKRQKELIAYYQFLIRANSLKLDEHKERDLLRLVALGQNKVADEQKALDGVDSVQTDGEEDDNSDGRGTNEKAILDEDLASKSGDNNLLVVSKPKPKNWFDSMIYKMVNSDSVRRICSACGGTNGIVPIEEKDIPYGCTICGHWNMSNPPTTGKA